MPYLFVIIAEATLLLLLERLFHLHLWGRAVLFVTVLLIAGFNTMCSIPTDPAHPVAQLLTNLTASTSVLIVWLCLSAWIRGDTARPSEASTRKR